MTTLRRSEKPRRALLAWRAPKSKGLRVSARLTQALIVGELNRFYGFGWGPDETLDLDEAFVEELLETARAISGK